MSSIFYGIYSNKKLPFRSQSFSGTDLDKDLKNPGIVYPISKTKNSLQPSFSSIIEHIEDRTILAHSEYRIIGENFKNGDIEYIKGRCISIVYNEYQKITPSKAEKLLGLNYEEFYNEAYFISEEDHGRLSIVYDYTELLADLEFEPAFIILDKNLHKQEHTLFDFASYTKKVQLFQKRPDLIKSCITLRKDIKKLAKKLAKNTGLNEDNIISNMISENNYEKDILTRSLEEYSTPELDGLNNILTDILWDLELSFENEGIKF